MLHSNIIPLLAPSCSPEIKTIFHLNSTSVRVEWYALPNTTCRNGILRGYKIAYKTLDDDEVYWSITSNPNSTSVIVTGLKKLTNYSFQVLAYTVKDGNLSKAVFAKTEDGKLSIKHINLFLVCNHSLENKMIKAMFVLLVDITKNSCTENSTNMAAIANDQSKQKSCLIVTASFELYFLRNINE